MGTSLIRKEDALNAVSCQQKVFWHDEVPWVPIDEVLNAIHALIPVEDETGVWRDILNDAAQRDIAYWRDHTVENVYDDTYTVTVTAGEQISGLDAVEALRQQQTICDIAESKIREMSARIEWLEAKCSRLQSDLTVSALRSSRNTEE